jgi:hypothetical protein
VTTGAAAGVTAAVFEAFFNISLAPLSAKPPKISSPIMPVCKNAPGVPTDPLGAGVLPIEVGEDPLTDAGPLGEGVDPLVAGIDPLAASSWFLTRREKRQFKTNSKTIANTLDILSLYKTQSTLDLNTKITKDNIQI